MTKLSKEGLLKLTETEAGVTFDSIWDYCEAYADQERGESNKEIERLYGELMKQDEIIKSLENEVENKGYGMKIYTRDF